ncbi:hypothetical protein ALO71_200115 [Pseudomonas amygdali pv. dendropanacis]|uniref:30S ribosomal protein S13 n=1 Tax=Pseudomonas amygdali pv. dendropanacis TaxID=235272 RepID=A0A0P9TUY9_PSEA0|nr:hypothetical protein [Pseudomonas amygdali]KPX17139.1 hypothetical protein ALO71_200115 [Pseudomonas amygdali pv. dendropanacis]
MNGRGFDVLILPFLVVFMFLLNVKYLFLPPFTNGMAKDGSGKVVVVTHEETIINKEKEKQRVEQLEKEAEEIKAEYAQAYKDCNSKSYEKYGSTSAISVEYLFNSYTKTCSKTTKMGNLVEGTTGNYTNNFKIIYETEFVRSELRDYMLVYRQ